jgi:RNA polymerase sigma-70 factor (ECF subfamily)
MVVGVMVLPSTRGATSAPQENAASPMPAWIVATSPAIGATDVDPKLTEITITFDRDMGAGMSWTGGKPFFPPADGNKQAQWRDKRTCVLPVKLKQGQFYRAGINAQSFLNFRSQAGEPAPCTAIYFVTKGATKSVESRVRVPQIVKMVPDNGAADVDPETKALRVSFNMPMGAGMSWTGGGANFPEAVAGQKPKWSGDGKTCILPVKLKPDHDYEIGLNSLQHINFQSKWGVPLKPVEFKFWTTAE